MPATDQGKAPAYKVKRAEPVIRGSDVQARLFTLAPGEAIPWHYHRQSTDHYFVLEGVLSISTREPDVMRSDKDASPGVAWWISGSRFDECL